VVLVSSDCGNPQCQPESGNPCCATDCTYTTARCRDSADDCDVPEYCDGTSNQCPPDDDAQSETPVEWDWVGNSGQLKVWIPVCDQEEADAQWIKIKFSGIEEIDSSGKVKGNLASVNNLASQDFTTRTLSRNEADQISNEFSYTVDPSDVAQITSHLSVDGADVTFTLTIFYFDDDSSVTWTDSESDERRSYHIPANSIKFNVGIDGGWPWSGDDHSLMISLDILWATGGEAQISDDDDGVKVDVSADSLEAYISFPSGSLSPLVVDGNFADAVVNVDNKGSHVTVDLIIPHFTQSAVYDPSIIMTNDDDDSPASAYFFSCLLALFLVLNSIM